MFPAELDAAGVMELQQDTTGEKEEGEGRNMETILILISYFKQFSNSIFLYIQISRDKYNKCYWSDIQYQFLAFDSFQYSVLWTHLSP